MKVVSSADLCEKGICQNAELASSLVNTWAPASWASVDLTAGSGFFPLHTLWFSLVTDSHFSIRLGNNNHACTPCSWLIRFGNDSQLFHLLEFCLHSFHEGDCYLSWSRQSIWFVSWFEFNLAVSFKLSKAIEQLWELLCRVEGFARNCFHMHHKT